MITYSIPYLTPWQTCADAYEKLLLVGLKPWLTNERMNRWTGAPSYTVPSSWLKKTYPILSLSFITIVITSIWGRVKIIRTVQHWHCFVLGVLTVLIVPSQSKPQGQMQKGTIATPKWQKLETPCFSHRLYLARSLPLFLFLKDTLKDTFPSKFALFMLLVQQGMAISLHLLLEKSRSYLDPWRH